MGQGQVALPSARLWCRENRVAEFMQGGFRRMVVLQNHIGAWYLPCVSRQTVAERTRDTQAGNKWG